MEDVYLQPVIVQSMEENAFQVYVSLVMLGKWENILHPGC